MRAKYREALPQLTGEDFLTDGGMETTLIFLEGVDLPHFAAFTLLDSPTGRAKLKDYYRKYLDYAAEKSVGFILESPTWRASSDWGDLLSYSPRRLADANRDAIALMAELREEYETERTPHVISGNLGPRGDGYRPQSMMSAEETEAYHGEQIAVFDEAGVDLISAFTLTYPEEAIGIARAAKARSVPSVISITTETDGRLPTGASIGDAIQAIDDATGRGPAYYMINCAHPRHFEDALEAGADWINRVAGLRANASTRSHAELDEATTLDPGDPLDLAAGYQRVARALPLNIFGGCCGTDHRHVKAIFEARLA